MIAGMVVVRHEGGDLAFEIAGQVVVLKQDAVSFSVANAFPAIPAMAQVSTSIWMPSCFMALL